MRDLNYFPLNVESNIYGMTTLEFGDRTSKVLIATSDCRIYCINYSKFKPHTREVEFTYIPSGARIISIGALKRGSNDYAIGITHSLAPNVIKNSARESSNFSGRETGEYGRLTTYYLNIYASGSICVNFDLDYVAQGCQTIRLKYVPYHLYQTELISIDSKSSSTKRKPFWLLSGGDNNIHALCEDRPYQSFTEIPIEDCFPEFGNLSGLVLWIDVMNLENCDRVAALGFEDGSVTLYHSTLSKTRFKYELVKESKFDQYTTIIPSVRLFRPNFTLNSKVRNLAVSKGIMQTDTKAFNEKLNLLVVSSTNSSIVFSDVIVSGLERKQELPESQRLDCVVASAIGDINTDGFEELILGTHGRELLIYQYDCKQASYCLAKEIELNHSIYSMTIFDLTGDSLKDLTILLASGVLVMQADVNHVIEVCKNRLNILVPSLQ